MNWPLLSRTMTSVDTMSKLRADDAALVGGTITGLSGEGCCAVAEGGTGAARFARKVTRRPPQGRRCRHLQRPLKINGSHGFDYKAYCWPPGPSSFPSSLSSALSASAGPPDDSWAVLYCGEIPKNDGCAGGGADHRSQRLENGFIVLETRLHVGSVTHVSGFRRSALAFSSS